MRKFLPTVLGLFVFIVTAGFAIQAWDNEVPYPEGFRRWTHVKTKLVQKRNHNERFIHIYANDKAIDGYSTGKFLEGSILIFDVIEATMVDSITGEGARKHTDVMMKDSINFASTGGWGYEEFKGDSKTERTLTVKAKTGCFNCHAHQQDYVFSEFRN